MMRSSVIVPLGVVVLAVSACGLGATDETTTSDAATVPPTKPVERTVPASLHAPFTSVPDWFHDEVALPETLAKTIAETLAAQYGVGVDAVVLLGSSYTQWPNSGLGCPKPGEQVLQVLTDGYLAFFDVAGQTVRVHAASNGAWRVCDTPVPDTLPTK